MLDEGHLLLALPVRLYHAFEQLRRLVEIWSEGGDSRLAVPDAEARQRASQAPVAASLQQVAARQCVPQVHVQSGQP